MFDGIVGLTYTDPQTYSFLMRVTNKENADVSTYLAEEISSSMSFEDGTVVYPDDKPPTLDREGLQWGQALVNEEVKVVWNEGKRAKGGVFFGKIISYDNLTFKHQIVFDDGDKHTVDLFDCYKLISEWQITPKQDTEVIDTDADARKIRRETREISSRMEISKTPITNKKRKNVLPLAL